MPAGAPGRSTVNPWAILMTNESRETRQLILQPPYRLKPDCEARASVQEGFCNLRRVLLTYCGVDHVTTVILLNPSLGYQWKICRPLRVTVTFCCAER